MPNYLANRPTEEAALADFLDSAAQTPSALLIDGEAGIGKSTLWLAALDRASRHGFQILAARTSSAESVAAYATLAELLAEVPDHIVTDLPTAQRAALEQVRGDGHEAAPTDQRAVAAAFLSVVEQLAEQEPVLLAVDDAQWIDQSSAHVLAYTARRLSGPVGVLGTVRTEGTGDSVSWLQMRRPDAVQRITLRPLPSRALQSVITEHLGRPVPRATMTRIYQISGGNPFYAIELAKVFESGQEKPLPHTLAAVVQARLGGLEPDALAPLLAAATAAGPTVELVAAAVGTDYERTVELLETAEQHGIIAIEGNRIRFTHPLLATGVYTSASADQRREMHRRLASVVGETETQARHLALAATTGDDATVTALERAAVGAQVRGAPAAAAELMELAITLGGPTPQRRIRLAQHVFDAGDPGRARTLLERAIAELASGPARAQARHLLAVVRFIDDGFVDAVELLQLALAEDRPDGPLRAVMLTTLAYGHYMTGDPEAGRRRAQEAVSYAEDVGVPGLLSQALGARAIIEFFTGGGVDEASMRRALELEDHDHFAPVMLRPSLEQALILACLGELDASFDLMREIERRCIERGEEGELVFVEFYVALTRIWRGDFAAAEQLAHNVTELAHQLGGGFPAMLSAVLRAWLAVYRGAERQARQAIAEALDASERSGAAWHRDWTVTALGLLEVSLGNFEAAVEALQPLLDRFVADSTEIHAASFVADAVEALVELGRAAEAEAFVAALERNGERLDRPWMLAVGGRCRALLLAATGDLPGAQSRARRAIEQHGRLSMPFELARTTLVLGRLQRRARDHAAAVTLREAVAEFERLGTPLWADRARDQLGRLGGSAATRALTAAELRIAELAATGLTNRDVAGELFLSAKTVEATLARVYRKLGIRSRAELGRVMGKPDG